MRDQLCRPRRQVHGPARRDAAAAVVGGDRLRATLAAVAALLRDARDDWWVIGSAAVWLHRLPAGSTDDGRPPDLPADIDVLLSPADAARLRPRIVAARGSADSDRRFRSAFFGRWEGAPLPVELMADLTVRAGEAWQPVRLTTRVAVTVGDATLWVPARGELIDLLTRFGRAKDLARAAVLRGM